MMSTSPESGKETKMDLVTVVIPSYNADEGLQRAIESVLGQTYPEVEVIVVDDNEPGSIGRKRTETLMQRFAEEQRVKYLKHAHNKNGAAARNTGIRAASGSFVAFLDDDDIYYPDRVRRCMDVFAENPQCDAVYTGVDLYVQGKKRGEVHPAAQGKAWRSLLLNEGMLGTGSNLFLKKEAIESVNGFDESFIRYQDVEFMLRILKEHNLQALDEILVRKNILERNIPPYKKYRENKIALFQKFSDLISQLTEQEKRSFFDFHYSVLYHSALSGGTRGEIQLAAKELQAVRPLTIKEKVAFGCPWLWRQYYCLKNRK